jgi:ribose transport system ATP-binding protein
MSALLEVRGLSKRYGGVQALDGAALTVRRGEMHGLIGPNGSGKSTLLSIVAGATKADAGELCFDGAELSGGHLRRVRRAGIHLVAQELTVVPGVPVWENVVLGAAPARQGFVRRRAGRRAAAAAFERLGVDVPVDQLTGTLAPVDQRLAMIAQGVAQDDARLLILDEPTAGLPAEESHRVIAAIAGLVDDRRSVLVVSHHLDELVSCCHSVTALRDGRTAAQLRGDEVSKEVLVDLLLSGVDVADEDLQEVDRPALGDVLVRLDEARIGPLAGLSFEARRGEIVGVAGLLGAGVDEVLDVLVGARRAQSGTVAVGADGVAPSSPHRAVRAGVGFLTGDRAQAVVPKLSVNEHVWLPPGRRLRNLGFVRRRAERRGAAGHLRTLEVKGAPEAPMRSLSGGNQQRALLARWLATDVDVLVVDRPTVGVDIAGRAALLETLRALADRRAVVISADADELATICDRVVCLRKGRKVATLEGPNLRESAILDAIS